MYPSHPAADLFPLLDEEALGELAESIDRNGLREAVWLYRDPVRGEVLLDGRNRALACERLGVTPEVRFYAGADPVAFVIDENLKRRHLSTGQRAKLAVEALPLLEAEAKPGRPRKETVADRPQFPEETPEERRHLSTGQRAKLAIEARPKVKRATLSRDKAAKAAGTSGRSVARYKRLVEQAPDLAAKVGDGMALDRAERIVRDRAAQTARVADAQREASLADNPVNVDIRPGDFRTVLADITGTVDAVITDPPYPREFLPLLGDLAKWADQALKPDGVLVVLLGQSYLPDAYRLLDGFRSYRWTACYQTSGPAYVARQRRCQSNWKPLLIYGGGPRFSDVFQSSGDDKAHHKWGQNYSAFHAIVARCTSMGDTVADPFMGAGTTLLAAHAQGRHVIGADIDEAAVQTARDRVAS